VEAMNIDVDSDMDMKIPEDVTIIDPDVETTEEAVVEPPRADDGRHIPFRVYQPIRWFGLILFAQEFLIHSVESMLLKYSLQTRR
jgi:hypothetical protein